MNQYGGEYVSGFLSFDAFLSLIHPKLIELKYPSFQLIEDIYDIIDFFLEERI